jgi:osmoprotectant transport system ATP-binding protein
VIRLTALVKRFAGAPRPAIDGLDLAVGEGEICVLIGPSGCGKTTTMRMINRLLEPDGGTIEVGGRNVTHMDPVALRRGIGYVIQQVGLFPHLTIAANVATVPRLLGWDGARTARRVDELLELVGMDPAAFRERYPRELSGGQRQRVGVARALAADPPVLLMDEPFGALDPVNRARLQDEFLRIQRQLRKTVVFVTHDIDEAIKVGDRIALLRDGRLVQHASPAELLAHPAGGFALEFVGADRALKRLSLFTCGALARPGRVDGAPEVAAAMNARDGLALMLGAGASALNVEGGGVVGLEEFLMRDGAAAAATIGPRVA